MITNSFIKFLKESQIEGEDSFYNLYYTQFPSKKTEEMKDSPEKDKATEIEEIKYKKLFLDFLKNVAAMQ